jgi:ABC-type nitrate/sulfonate/bicarbonate transport system substrate-binding protein
MPVSKDRLLKSLPLYLLVILCGLSDAVAQTVRVAYPSNAVVFLPLWTAADAGFFAKRNVSVELVAIRSSPVAMTALLSGEVDIVVGGANPGIALQLQGYKDVAIFAGLINRFLFSIYSQPGIEELSQLRGKRLGVTRFGGSNDFAARYYLRQRGIDPIRELTLIQIGSQDDILRALLAKNLDAAVLGYPSVYVAKKQGLRELADLTRSGLRYQLTAFVAKRSFLAERQLLMTGMFKALAESIHFLRTRPKEGMAITKRHARIDDPEILASAYDLHVKLYPRLPEIEAEDLKLVLEEIALTNAKARDAEPAVFIDDRVGRELSRSGFADQLYR